MKITNRNVNTIPVIQYVKYNYKWKNNRSVVRVDMFTKDDLLVIQDALSIADEEFKRLMDENKSNKNRLVAFNRKQKKLWLVQNKLKKIMEEK